MPGRSGLRRSRPAVFAAGVAVGALAAACGAAVGVAAGLGAPGGWPTLALLGWLAGRRERAAAGASDAELARMSWRLDFALAASNIGVWDVDLNTDEMIWDKRAQALFGVPRRDGYFSEADWVGALHPGDRARAVAAANDAIAGDGRFVSDYRVVHPDGSVRHLRDMAAAFRGEDGSHRLVGLVWDMTPDLERQEGLESSRAEAEAATVAKSQFLAAMSHEIRTPMTGVLGMLDLMLAEPLPEGQRERAAIARSSALSLLQILNDILEYSKLEARRLEPVEEDVRPREVVRDVIALMAAGAERKGLALAWSVSDAVPEWIVTDPMRLRQILTNLVSNATKFTEVGRVEVRVDYAPDGEGAGGELRVAVEDTGIGVAPEIAGRLFEEFFQADTSLSRRRGGTGLGLAISRQLVELLGGRIEVRSEPGVGSTFWFAVRVRPGVAPAGEPRLEAATPAAEGGAMRVLLAEDNATNQYLIRAYLEARGHGVVTVENGAEAVRAAAGGGFDVILMDVQMPEMDGPTAARAIRVLPGPAATVPIVALTANALRGDRESYLAAGMTDYISKPIDFEALVGALRRARSGAPPRPPEEPWAEASTASV